MAKETTTRAVGLATAAAAAAAGSAQADIVYTELGPTAGALNAAGDIVGIDFNQDGVREVEIQYTEPVTGNLNIKIEAFPVTGLDNVTDEILVDSTQAAGIANNPLALQFGETIDANEVPTRAWEFVGRVGPDSTSSSGISGSNGGGNFRFGDPEQFIGVRTIIDGNTHYGWIGIVITDEFNDGVDPLNDRLSGFVTGYAYESRAGVGIAAGAIPSPGAAALLALGAVGLGGCRPRRKVI